MGVDFAANWNYMSATHYAHYAKCVTVVGVYNLCIVCWYMPCMFQPCCHGNDRCATGDFEAQ